LQGDDNLRNIYKQSSICLQPVHSQGAYATVLEGISAGIPTVVSDEFVASSLICNNLLGWVSSSAIEEYVSKICMIHDDYQRCKEETEEGAKWIGENLTWRKFGERYEKMIEDVLA